MPSVWTADLVLIASIASIASLVIVFVEVVAKPGRRLWRWATQRRRLCARLRHLACEVQVRTFEDALGRPPQYRSQGETTNEYLFVLEDVYVQAITDRNDSVTHFAITTRSSRFHPTLSLPGVGEVVLGRTTFSELDGGLSNGLSAWVGARRSSYAEAYYVGNPGYYQTYVVALNDAGVSRPVEGSAMASLPEAIRELGGSEGATFGSFLPSSERRESGGAMPRCWQTRPSVARFRGASPIDTFAVAGPRQDPASDPGPDLDQVRLLNQPR